MHERNVQTHSIHVLQAVMGVSHCAGKGHNCTPFEVGSPGCAFYTEVLQFLQKHAKRLEP